MKTRKITTAFAASVAALLFGTVAAFGAEPRVWTNSRGEIALRGTFDVERTLDETPGVEAPNRVYFVDATGDLYSFRYRHLSEADRALVDEALDEPAPPKKVGTRRDVATPLGTPLRTLPLQTAPLEIPTSRPRAEAKLAVSQPVVSPKSDSFLASERPATVRVKIKLVDASGAPIPRAWFQGKILGGAATTSLRAHCGSDGGFTIALTPGVEYEALVTAPRGGSAVFYERAKFRAPEANFDSASLTLNVGEGKEMKLTDRAAQEISNEFRPEDEALETLAIEAKPTEPASNGEKATSRNGKTAAFETKTAMKLKFVDANGAPIPKIAAQVQRIKRPSPTHWWRSESGEGVYTIDLTPGEYEARATAWRGNEDVIYEGTTFTVGQGNGEPVELTVNVGEIIKPDDEAKPAEPASNDENATLGATLGSAARKSNAVESREKTTLKVVDSVGKPVPFAVVEASQVVQEGELTVYYDLRADGAGVVSAEFPRGVEYEATVRADVPERVLKEGETGLVGLVAKKYEGLRFYVPEGTGERVVVLTLSDDAEVADKPKTAESEENALNDGEVETSDAE
ncbi:MAG: hypothetical protein IKK39_00725 [Thermoguttaceae bacterium]|nr:hypothetical protein [Thermoguttaceae bacterium]MBR4102570.1 hypothetical protein [Thermoguttaceae bacterium]